MAKNNKHNSELKNQMDVRRQKMQNLREQGINPFGHRYEPDTTAQMLHDHYDASNKDDVAAAAQTVTIAGRMMSKRGKGKVGFADIKDRTG